MVKFYVVFDINMTNTHPVICVSRYIPNSASIDVAKGTIINNRYVELTNNMSLEYYGYVCVYFNVHNTLKKLYFLRVWEYGKDDDENSDENSYENEYEDCIKKSMYCFSKFKYLLDKTKEIIEENNKTWDDCESTEQILKDLTINKKITIGTNQCEFDINWFEHCVTFDKRDAI